MKDLAALLGAVAWPLVVGGAIWFFRKYIVAALDAARRQFSSGARLKWKDFEFEGVNLSAFSVGGAEAYRREVATKALLDQREAKYAEQKNLFLVHRVAPTGSIHDKAELPTYDVLIKLVRHKHYGRLNDVARVEYYFGKYFGRDVGEYGAKYVVEDGSDGFAVRIDGYGPTLCEATVFFHDGSVATCSRYLDFEGTSYVYHAGRVSKVDHSQKALTKK
jgi:hypothetical protein